MTRIRGVALRARLLAVPTFAVWGFGFFLMLLGSIQIGLGPGPVGGESWVPVWAVLCLVFIVWPWFLGVYRTSRSIIVWSYFWIHRIPFDRVIEMSRQPYDGLLFYQGALGQGTPVIILRTRTRSGEFWWQSLNVTVAAEKRFRGHLQAVRQAVENAPVTGLDGDRVSGISEQLFSAWSETGLESMRAHGWDDWQMQLQRVDLPGRRQLLCAVFSPEQGRAMVRVYRLGQNWLLFSGTGADGRSTGNLRLAPAAAERHFAALLVALASDQHHYWWRYPFGRVHRGERIPSLK